jgi:hypothetical protein
MIPFSGVILRGGRIDDGTERCGGAALIASCASTNPIAETLARGRSTVR